MGCRMKVRAELSQHFITSMENYLLENIKQSSAQSLPFVIPLLLEQNETRNLDRIASNDLILKILSQKDFSAATYILILGQLIEFSTNQQRSVDLEFWRQVVQYVPQIELENPEQYFRVKGCLQYLDENIKELDFSGLINYLEGNYEREDSLSDQLILDKSRSEESLKVPE